MASQTSGNPGTPAPRSADALGPACLCFPFGLTAMRMVLMICVACGLLVVVGANLQRSIDIARISALYGLLEPTSRTRPLDDPVFRERLDDLFETGSRLDQFMMLCTSEIDQRLVVIEPMILSKHDFVSGVWCFSWGRMGAA